LGDDDLGGAELPDLKIDLDLGGDNFALSEESDGGALDVPDTELDAPDVPDISVDFDDSSLSSILADSRVIEANSGDNTDSASAETSSNTQNADNIQTGPSADDCAKFNSAPSCDYVPADLRDICLQCKTK